MLSILLPWLFCLSSPSTSFSLTILSIAQHLSQFLSQSPNQYCRFPFLISLSAISLCSALFCLGLVLFLSLSLSSLSALAFVSLSLFPFTASSFPPSHGVSYRRCSWNLQAQVTPCQHLATSPSQVMREFQAEDMGHCSSSCLASGGSPVNGLNRGSSCVSGQTRLNRSPSRIPDIDLCTFLKVYYSCPSPPSFLSSTPSLSPSLAFDLSLASPWHLSFSQVLFPLLLFVLSHDQAPSLCSLTFLFLSHYFFLMLSLLSPYPLPQPGFLFPPEEPQTLSLLSNHTFLPWALRLSSGSSWGIKCLLGCGVCILLGRATRSLHPLYRHGQTE